MHFQEHLHVRGRKADPAAEEDRRLRQGLVHRALHRRQRQAHHRKSSPSLIIPISAHN